MSQKFGKRPDRKAPLELQYSPPTRVVSTQPSQRDSDSSGGSYLAPKMFGNYFLWVDATGDLRIKATAPTTDLDGTVVGTQS